MCDVFADRKYFENVYIIIRKRLQVLSK